MRMLAGTRYGLDCNRCCGCAAPPGGGQPTAAETAKALDRLQRGFQYVGLTDDYALSVCLFHAKFGGARQQAERDGAPSACPRRGLLPASALPKQPQAVPGRIGHPSGLEEGGGSAMSPRPI